MARKILSWGGDTGQLDVGLGADGNVMEVVLWRRFTALDEWQGRLAWQGAPLVQFPSLKLWEKRRSP